MDLPKFKKEKTKLQQIEELEEQIARRKAEELAKVAPAPQPTQTLNAAPNPSNSMYDNIPKKTAALEVIRVLKMGKIVGVGTIIGAFLILLAATFNTIMSYGVAMLLIVPAAVFIQRTNTELVRLKKEYSL
jgi:hypothetical protein